MMVQISSRPPLPLTLKAAMTESRWQETPWWPISQSQLRVECGQSLRCVRDAVRTVPSELEAIVQLIAPLAANWSAALTNAAIMLRDSRRYETLGLSDLQRGLFDEEARRSFLSSLQPKSIPPIGRYEAGLRHVVRTLSWSTPLNVLRNLFAPRVLAVSHNSLMVRMARQSNSGVAFRHARICLDESLAKQHQFRTELAYEAAHSVAKALAVPEGLHGKLEEGYRSFLMGILVHFALRAERDLKALDAIPFPAEVWTGSFGSWLPRAIGLTVLRRGGNVLAFDHGGGVGNVCDADYFEVMEVCGGASFVASSPVAADMIRKTLLRPEIPHSRVIAGVGDPAFCQVPKKKPAVTGRRRVVYSTTIFHGDRQFHPAMLPDPVYLHWQRQVLDALADMPVAATFKPAPEGLLRGEKHPLEGIVPTSDALFEKHLANGDVFIFDYAHTTTFWKALCSGSAVILLDMGVNALSPSMRAMVERRAEIINVKFANDGMPYLDKELFKDTIMTVGSADPGPFRELICAEQAE